MYIKLFTVNPLGVNCYLAYDDTKEGVLIDCGCSSESEWRTIKTFIDSEGIKVKHLLNTHLHFDHVWGLPYVANELGLKPEANELDLPLYNNINEMIENLFGFRIPLPAMPTIGIYLHNGDTITFGESELKVIATPGHSKGSLCFYSEKENVLFSGDTLFKTSIGRTDLEGGCMTEILQSLHKLMELPPETDVLSGHGPSTTIAFELKNNMYL